MSDTVLIVLIIAIVVVVILVLYRDRLSRFFIKGSSAGVEAELEARKPTSATPPAPPAAELKAGAVTDSKVLNQAPGDATLTVQDISDSTVENVAGKGDKSSSR
jgi:hypothetical protein